MDTLLDIYQHAFGLVNAFQPPTTGIVYRMLSVATFSDSFLLTIHIRDDAASTAKLVRLRHLGEQEPDWILTAFRLQRANQALPETLPNGVDPNIEERPLSASQVAWFKHEMARIDAAKLVSCGRGYERDGHARRCWVCRPDAADHVFDEWAGDERAHPDVFAFGRAVYRLGASVMRARFSLGCLVPQQHTLYDTRHGLPFVADQHCYLEHYLFDLVM